MGEHEACPVVEQGSAQVGVPGGEAPPGGQGLVAALDMAPSLGTPRPAPLLVVSDLVAKLLEFPRRDVVGKDAPGKTAVHRFKALVHQTPSVTQLPGPSEPLHRP